MALARAPDWSLPRYRCNLPCEDGYLQPRRIVEGGSAIWLFWVQDIAIGRLAVEEAEGVPGVLVGPSAPCEFPCLSMLRPVTERAYAQSFSS
jgi:hypothetical protein